METLINHFMIHIHIQTLTVLPVRMVRLEKKSFLMSHFFCLLLSFIVGISQTDKNKHRGDERQLN